MTLDISVPGIVTPAIKHHGDVISRIESGCLNAALDDVKDWLNPSQKDGVKSVAAELVDFWTSRESE
jgi:hypothetical protein